MPAGKDPGTPTQSRRRKPALRTLATLTAVSQSQLTAPAAERKLTLAPLSGTSRARHRRRALPYSALLAWFLATILSPHTGAPAFLPAARAQTVDVERLLADEKNPEVLSAAAQQLAVAKQLQPAEKLWQRALDLSPDFFPALFNLGYMHFSAKQFEKALPFLDRAAQNSPNDFNSHYLRGATLQQLGRRDEALRAWRKALAIQPKNQRLLQVMAVEYGAGRYFQEAADLARRALELKADDPNLYFIAIKAYQDAGSHSDAMQIAEQAVSRFPNSARANFEYAFHLQKSGQFEECLPYLKKAMELDPRYEEPFFFYGDVLVKRAQYEEAIPPLRQAIEIRPDYVAARVTLGRAWMGLHKWDEAVTEFQQAARQQPDHPQPHLLLSQVYFRLHDEEKARQEKELSLRLRRENPTFLESVQGRPFPE
jgi:tetratricopeptide (TPR) repeat protein